MNADRTVYGRYGSRGGKEAGTSVSLDGFKKAMSGALELHANYPRNKRSLVGKTGLALPWRTPEVVPELKGKHRKDDITQKGCIHCHDVQDAMVPSLRAAGKPVADRVIWPYPMPDTLGLKMAVHERAVVEAATNASPAEQAGFESGDEILTMEGQPLISIADIQWILHQAPGTGEIEAEVNRNEQKTKLVLPLEKGWRRKGDMSWRTMGWHVSRLPGFQMRTRPSGNWQLSSPTRQQYLAARTGCGSRHCRRRCDCGN